MGRLYVIALLALLAGSAHAQICPRFQWGTTFDVTGQCTVVRFDSTLLTVTKSGGICTVGLGSNVFVGANGGCIGDSGGGFGSDWCASINLAGKIWDYSSATSMTLKSGTVVPGTLSFSGATSGSSVVQAPAVASGTSTLPVYSGQLTSSVTVITSDGTVGNTATETSLAATGSLAANTLQVGKTFRITAGGKFSTHTTGTQTLQFNLRFGSTNTSPILVTWPTTGTLTTSLAARPWNVTAYVTVRSTGASGVAVGGGLLSGIFGSSSAEAITEGCTSGTAGSTATCTTVTIDTTAAQPISLFVKHANAQTLNTITASYFIVEQVN